MYQLRHFVPEEFLPPGVTDLFLMDEHLLETADDIRDLVGPMSINDYHMGGSRQWCGLRTPDCDVGAPHSQHRLGKAADGHPARMTADAARDLIRAAVARGELPYLGGLEVGVSWVHFDVRPRVDGKVVEFHA